MSPLNGFDALLAWLDEQRPAMIELLAKLVDTDSGSYDHEGVDRVGEILRRHLDARGVATEVIAVADAGFCLKAAVAADRVLADSGHVLLLGHRDTVFPKGEAAARPFRIEGARAFGPGVADMKAGLVMNSFVVEAFRRFGGHRQPIHALYTSDEEIGSPRSKPVIEAEARGARAVFNSEPGRPSGNVVSGRKGAMFIRLETIGVAAHAGAAHDKGASAIEALCRKVQALHALTDYQRGRTVNVGLIGGGQSANTVAPAAHATIDVRFRTKAELAEIEAAIERIVARCEVEGTKATIADRIVFPPLEQTAANKELLDHYVAAAAEIGLTIGSEYSGGAADSGFASALGVPTVCAVGPIGENVHQPTETVHLDSLVPRAKALALAILRLT